MGKAPRRRRPRKVVARSSATRLGAAPGTTNSSTPTAAAETPVFVSDGPAPPRDVRLRLAQLDALRQELSGLAALAVARDEARRLVVGHDERIRKAVARLRRDGASWTQIGGALGISRQGARQQFDAGARAAHRSRRVHAPSTDSVDDVAPSPGRRTPAGDEQEDSRWTSWRP